MAGDAASAQLFEYLVSRASAPFLRMLEAWIYRGAIEDPYSEFLVAENKALTKQSLMEDYSDEYWTERYALRDASCPRFLESHATKILTTGKYINAVRECDGTRDLRCPMSSTPLSYTADERVYGAKIDAAFQWASKTLMDVLLVSESLLGRLASLKHYFLIDEGDWFVHFMDASAEELSKPVGELSRTKLESLLELSIRTSICNADTYKEDVSVVLLREPLAHQLTKIFMAARPGLQVPKMPTTNPNLLSGLEAFALDYKVKWPLSLVVNRRAMAKYQLLFRHLFNCKHVERQLSGTWAQQQVLKEYRVHHLLQRVYSLRQRMLHFLQNYEYYMMVEVLEPAWHSMAQKIRSSGSATSSASSGLSGASPAADADAVLTIDDVMRLHNDFLDTCLKACLLTNIHLINRLSKILRVCLVYSKNMDAFFRDLISDTLGAEKPRGDKKVAAHARERSERIDVSSAVMRASLDDEAFTATIARLENDYTNHLRDLLETLGAHSHSSAGESHLSHLITRLDYNGFYKSSMRS
jgi:gamma-tubulin complex component 2